MKKVTKKKTAPKSKSRHCDGDCGGKCDCGPDEERCTCGGKGPGHKKARK